MERARRITIVDVAKAAGVSKTSVSFAFNAPERLRPETLTRIREVAETLDYRPDPTARRLAQRRTGTIGIVTPQGLPMTLSNPYFVEFAAGVASASDAAGYTLQFISPIHGSPLRALDRSTTAGIIALGPRNDRADTAEIRRSGLPFVFVDSAVFPDEPSVTVDDEAGGRAAAQHLLDLGHRDFLILSLGPLPSTRGDPHSVRARRMAGYSGALAAHGIVLGPESVVFAPANVRGGFDAFSRAWASGLRPTAVLAMSDAMAVGVVRAARSLSVSIPDELSVVGFDDIDIAQWLDPPLTTVHQPSREKGVEAVRLLLASASRREDTWPEQRMLQTRLIVRGSTALAPRKRREVPQPEP